MEFVSFDNEFVKLKRLGHCLIEAAKQDECFDSHDLAQISALFEQFTEKVELAVQDAENRKQLKALQRPLEQFLQISLPGNVGEDPLHSYKETIKAWLQQPAENAIHLVQPYALFVKIVQQPDMDLSDSEDELIHDTFLPSAIRLLYQGKFVLDDNVDCAIAVASHTPTPEQPTQQHPVQSKDERPQEEIEPEPIKSPEPVPSNQVLIQTEKENTPFRIKEFMSTYFQNNLNNLRRGGELEVNVSRVGDLNLLHIFSKLGMLTLQQLQLYVFSPNTPETGFQRLLKNGYLSLVVDNNTQMEFYALSKKGTEVFEVEKSVRMMRQLEFVYKPTWNIACTLPYLYSNSEAYLQSLTAALFLRKAAIESHGFTVDTIRIDCVAPELAICIWMHDSMQNTTSLFLVRCLEDTDQTGVQVIVLSTDIEEPKPHKNGFSHLPPNIDFEGKLYFTCEVDEDCTKIAFFEPDGIQVSEDKVFASLSSLPESIEVVDHPFDVGEFPLEGRELPFDQETASQPDLKTGDVCTQEPRDLALSEPQSELFSFPRPMKPHEARQAGGVQKETPQNRIPTGAVLSAIKDPSVLAEKLLSGNATPEHRELFFILINRLLARAMEVDSASPTDYLGRALVLLKALSLAEPELYKGDYERLLLATDLPLDVHQYTSEVLRASFTGKHEGTAAHLAAVLRALFCQEQVYDYDLIPYANGLLEQFDTLFTAFAPYKHLLSDFLLIPTTLSGGFTDAVTSGIADAAVVHETMQKIRADAKRLQALPNIKQRINGLPQMLDQCFGQNSPLGCSIHAILNEQAQGRATVAGILQAFSNGDEVSLEKIEEAIQDTWGNVRKTVNLTSPKLDTYAQNRMVEAYQERLVLLKSWLAHISKAEHVDAVPLEKLLFHTRQMLLQGIGKLNTTKMRHEDRSILSHMLSMLSAKLDRTTICNFSAEYWLSSGILSLDAKGPIIHDACSNVPYYEPWRNVLKHVAQKPLKLSSVLEKIDDPADDLYDNLGQAIQICTYLNDQDKAELYRCGIPNAQANAEKVVLAFKSALNIDYAYNRIEEQVKETVLRQIDQWKPYFWDSSNFAQLNQFLAALRRTLDEEVMRNRMAWLTEIQNRRGKGGIEEYLDRAAHFLQSKDANFIQIEDVLSSFDTNMAPDMETPAFDSENMFEEYINQPYYDKLLDVCRGQRGKAFRDFAPAFVKVQVEQVGRSRQYTRSSELLVSSLPNKPQDDGANGIKCLLEELGFTVSKVTRSNARSSPACFRAEMIPDKMNRAYYMHPIAEMGTRIPKEINVIELFGSVEPESILSNVRKFDSHHTPIVFLNGSLTLGQRRQLAALFHQDGKTASPFILVDWVLLLHLATKLKEDRLKTLLACTLPYTGTKQLFSMTSAIPIADEMYIGRNDEMSKILDMNGPVIVYGGRQLGKTALLQRVKNRFHMPAEHHYSIFVDAKDCGDEVSFVTHICKELVDAGIKSSEATTISELCDYLRVWFSQNNGKLLMLVDEADNLLSTLAKVDYAPLTPLETLCRAANGNFKFVFAGLHNVFLAAKAKGGNPIFGHFGNPLCIKPMSHADAYKLLARPLSYLGFSIDAEMLLRVLINTNFYPGVVHLIGSKLIDMLTNQYAEHYNDKTNPPYQLTERQIGAIMNSTELNECIAERIRMTLEVDPAYLAIARCIALLYYFEEDKRACGYTAKEILDFASEMELRRLQKLNSDACVHLLLELCGMSILAEREGRYRFRQARFLTILAKDSDTLLEALSADEVSSDESDSR